MSRFLEEIFLKIICFCVTSEISHQKEIPVVLGTYFIDSLSRYLHGIDKEEFDSLD